MTFDAVESSGVVDQDPLAFGQDGVVGGVPSDPEPFGDASDGQVLDHDRLQSPPQPAARELGPRLGCSAGVLAPHVPALGTAVATHLDVYPGTDVPAGTTPSTVKSQFPTATPSPSATGAIVRCWTTIRSSAHRSPARGILCVGLVAAGCRDGRPVARLHVANAPQGGAAVTLRPTELR